MNPQVKELWIAALESGEFKQTTGLLKANDGYCCLGVLCMLAVQADVIPEPTYSPSRFAYTFGPGNNDVYTLPEAVRKWAKIPDELGVLTRPELVWGLDEDNPHSIRTFTALSELNDYANYDFKQIAQVIREQF